MEISDLPRRSFWLNRRFPLRVDTLAPDLPAPLSFAAYREGRDPAIEAMLAREAGLKSPAPPP